MKNYVELKTEGDKNTLILRNTPDFNQPFKYLVGSWDDVLLFVQYVKYKDQLKAHEPFKIEILLIQQKDCEPLFKALWESDISAQQVAAFVHGHFGIDYVLINAYAKRYNTKSPPDTLYYTTEFVGVPYILEQNYQNTVPSKPKTKSSDQSRFMHFCTYCISNYNMNIKLSKVCGLLSIASYFALGATTIALTFSAIGMVALANAIYIRKSKDTSLYNNL